MKRTVLFLTMAFCTITLVFAQNQPGPGRYPNEPPNRTQRGNFQRNNAPAPRNFPRKVESATVSGNLTVSQGMIAVNSDNVTYIAGDLQRFVGFIDGLKEGAAVTLEGNVFSVPQDETVKFLQVQKMTLNGKDYDLGPPQMAPRMSPQPQHMRPQHMHQGRNRGR